MKVCLSFPKDCEGAAVLVHCPGLPFIVVTGSVHSAVLLEIHFTPLHCTTLHQKKLLGLKMTYDWPAKTLDTGPAALPVMLGLKLERL